MEIPKTGLADWVAAVAKQHGVVAQFTQLDALAEVITHLSGDDVASGDASEKLVVALRRAGVISGAELVEILGNHFDELNQSKRA